MANILRDLIPVVNNDGFPNVSWRGWKARTNHEPIPGPCSNQLTTRFLPSFNSVGVMMQLGTQWMAYLSVNVLDKLDMSIVM